MKWVWDLDIKKKKTQTHTYTHFLRYHLCHFLKSTITDDLN